MGKGYIERRNKHNFEFLKTDKKGHYYQLLLMTSPLFHANFIKVHAVTLKSIVEDQCCLLAKGININASQTTKLSV